MSYCSSLILIILLIALVIGVILYKKYASSAETTLSSFFNTMYNPPTQQQAPYFQQQQGVSSYVDTPSMVRPNIVLTKSRLSAFGDRFRGDLDITPGTITSITSARPEQVLVSGYFGR